MDNIQRKSFWERKEGKFGLVVIGLLMLVTAAALPSIATMTALLAAIAANTFYTVMFSAATIASLYVLFNPKFQMLISFGFKLAMKKLTGMIIELDPINLLKILHDKAESKMNNLAENISKVKEETSKYKREIISQSKEAEKHNRLAEQAKHNNDVQEHAFHMQQAGRLLAVNKEYEAALADANQILVVLEKMKKAANYNLLNLKTEIKIREGKRAVILPGHNAMKSAMALIKGEEDTKSLWDDTMEYLVDDYERKLGAIMDGMDQAQQFVTTMDSQNGIYQQDAVKYFADWEKKAEANKLLTGPSNSYKPRSNEVEHVTVSNDFSDLFNDK